MFATLSKAMISIWAIDSFVSHTRLCAYRFVISVYSNTMDSRVWHMCVLLQSFYHLVYCHFEFWRSERKKYPPHTNSYGKLEEEKWFFFQTFAHLPLHIGKQSIEFIPRWIYWSGINNIEKVFSTDKTSAGMTNDYLNQEFQSIFGILTNYGEIRPLPVFAPIMNELVFEVHSLLFLTELHCHWPIFIKAHICSATDLIGTVNCCIFIAFNNTQNHLEDRSFAFYTYFMRVGKIFAHFFIPAESNLANMKQWGVEFFFTRKT